MTVIRAMACIVPVKGEPPRIVVDTLNDTSVFDARWLMDRFGARLAEVEIRILEDDSNGTD